LEAVPASLTLSLDDYDLDDFVALAAHYGQSSFGYVVTPNVDHVIRYCDDAEFRQLYAHAAYVLLDSRLLARILWLTRGMKPPVCPGSDLTARLVPLIAPRDPVVLIGGSAQQAQRLAEFYRIQGLRHYNPPMGFIRDPEAVEQTLRFVEAHSPFRFCFLAVGAPQQEMLAYALKQRGLARGLAFCFGASINFLTGAERRAPLWMQWLSLEWLYRLLQDPGRMAKRYLVRGPRIFWLLPRIQFELRRQTATVAGDGRSSRGPT
jgi:exopolysaccharide biosynthesis WecB/TagA/CpsF family protein